MLDFPRWKILSIIGVCLMFLLMALPNLFTDEQLSHAPSWLPTNKVSLGLDLRGGSDLLLQVDFEAYEREQLANMADEIRVKLRAENLGYRNILIKNGAVSFTLRELAEEEAVTKALRALSTDMVINRTNDAYQITYNDRWLKQSRQQILEQSLQIVERRVNESGTREPIIQRQGDNRILVQVPGLENPEHLKALLGKTAKMTFHLLDATVSQADIASGIMPPGTRLLASDEAELKNGAQARKYPVLSRVLVSGDMLVDAHAGFDSQNGESVVNFRFNTEGARKFGEITAANIGKPFAIVLDNKVITAPVIRSAILGGSGQISGGYNVQSANDLSVLLRAGALPAPLKVVEERSVGPSLGADSISAGRLAAFLGVCFVVLFMILNYGLFGLFADIAMIMNAIIVLALMSLLQATLTLPGIAGIVLTMGMAVDTNVLIYERMREEMRAGKTPFAAVESGFRMAFATIIDSHITTLSAALILFYFGTGTVKGFGVTLSIGIIASLFTAILVTRLMIVVWLKKTKPKTLPI